jgi:uncharacterized membrane protein
MPSQQMINTTSSSWRKFTDRLRPQPIWILVSISFLILFLCSSLKHGFFQSTTWDLGIFDQAVYLISQGQPPISSFLGYHILGDHAALILYPLALLYWIHPNVHWLLLVQALALALGAYPIFRLTLLAGLTSAQGMVAAVVYILYPVIFNINLFDFHPDVIALPALIWMILAARSRQIGQFCIALVITLSCKAVLSLTTAAMGLWLIFFEKRKWYGIIALVGSIAWFIIATQVIIPTVGSEAASITRHLSRYGALGNSFSDILLNIFLKPQIVLGMIFSYRTFRYLVFLFLPIIYIFTNRNPRFLLQFIPALPVLMMNILSREEAQRSMVHQYSLPILPFMMLAVISYLETTPELPKFLKHKNYTLTLCWAVLAFLIFSRIYFFFGSCYQTADTLQANREAISRIQTKENVLTTAEIAPHLTQRPQITFTQSGVNPVFRRFRYVLLDTSHPGWMSDEQFAMKLVDRLKKNQRFRLDYQKDGVYLFIRN